MISKKLLESVLGFDLISVERRGDFIFYVDTFTEKGKGVNIFELVHRCKEWAVEKGFTLNVYIGNIYRVSLYISTENKKQYSELADTESQAIIKACEWIMEQE